LSFVQAYLERDINFLKAKMLMGNTALHLAVDSAARTRNLRMAQLIFKFYPMFYLIFLTYFVFDE